MELSKNNKLRIKKLVTNGMEDLEDKLNDRLRLLLADEEHLDNWEALVYAREIFFRG